MTNGSFTDDDKQVVIDFLNMVAQKAKFELDTSEVIKYFKLLSRMQQNILPKIDANILEIKKVHEAPEEVSEEDNTNQDKEG